MTSRASTACPTEEINSLENCYPPPLNSSPSQLFFQFSMIYHCDTCPVALGHKEYLLHAPSVQRSCCCAAECCFGLSCTMYHTGGFLLTRSLGICILVEVLGTENIFSDAWTTPHSIQQKLLKY